MRVFDFSSGLLRVIRNFGSANTGNVAVFFGMSLIPLLGSVGVAVDYSRANSVRTALQAGLDTTALNLLSQAASLSNSALQTAAGNYFAANFNRPEAYNVQVNATYNAAANTLTMSGSATVNYDFMNIFGKPTGHVNTASTAAMGGTKRLPVCVLVTNLNSNHTLKVQNKATIDFTRRSARHLLYSLRKRPKLLRRRYSLRRCATAEIDDVHLLLRSVRDLQSSSFRMRFYRA